MENEMKIREYLFSLGFLPNKCGYRYLYDLINWGIYDEEIVPLKYYGYQMLAQKYNKQAGTIEKDIQNAIGIAWLKGDVAVLQRAFGETIDERKGKPSNKQFIMTAITNLKR